MPREYGGYSDVASEYYRAALHPTSANFRVASELIVDAWLPDPVPRAGLLCDVGAGDSVLAALLHRRRRSLRRVRLIDSAPGMLRHSKRWIDRGATGMVSDAGSIPINSGAATLILASLGDPFNTSAFWSEAARLLCPGGLLIYTTPSQEWATFFRQQHREPPDAAEFALRDGRKILLPSFIHREKTQIKMMRRAGFAVSDVYHVLVEALRHHPISAKLTSGAPVTSPIVTGFRAYRE